MRARGHEGTRARNIALEPRARPSRWQSAQRVGWARANGRAQHFPQFNVGHAALCPTYGRDA